MLPIAYSTCPLGATNVVKLDANDMIISYTQNPKIILRTALERQVLLLSIETMRTLEEMNDSAPVMMGEIMRAFCWFMVYMLLEKIYYVIKILSYLYSCEVGHCAPAATVVGCAEPSLLVPGLPLSRKTF